MIFFNLFFLSVLFIGRLEGQACLPANSFNDLGKINVWYSNEFVVSDFQYYMFDELEKRNLFNDCESLAKLSDLGFSNNEYNFVRNKLIPFHVSEETARKFQIKKIHFTPFLLQDEKIEGALFNCKTKTCLEKYKAQLTQKKDSFLAICDYDSLGRLVKLSYNFYFLDLDFVMIPKRIITLEYQVDSIVTVNYSYDNYQQENWPLLDSLFEDWERKTEIRKRKESEPPPFLVWMIEDGKLRDNFPEHPSPYKIIYKKTKNKENLTAFETDRKNSLVPLDSNNTLEYFYLKNHCIRLEKNDYVHTFDINGRNNSLKIAYLVDEDVCHLTFLKAEGKNKTVIEQAINFKLVNKLFFISKENPLWFLYQIILNIKHIDLSEDKSSVSVRYCDNSPIPEFSTEKIVHYCLPYYRKEKKIEYIDYPYCDLPLEPQFISDGGVFEKILQGGISLNVLFNEEHLPLVVRTIKNKRSVFYFIKYEHW